MGQAKPEPITELNHYPVIIKRIGLLPIPYGNTSPPYVKVKKYLRGRILDTKLAGRMASGMYEALCRVKPERALSELLPPLLQQIEVLLSAEDIMLKENVDQELLFNMNLLSSCIYR